MAVFLTLVMKLMPLYLMIGLGYIAGRFLELQSRHIAGTMIYMITPIIVFSGVMTVELSPLRAALPFMVWGICICISLLFLVIGRWQLRDRRANILALAVGTGNTGYFGIPVALLLLGESQVGLYILCMLGTTLHENSVGFYIAAKGRYPARECLRKVLRLPSLYAFMLALCLNSAGFDIPALLDSFVDSMRGAYTVFGMMIIGISIAGMSAGAVDGRFMGLAFIGKFLAWPLAIGLFVLLDTSWWHLFDGRVHQALWVLSFTPIAANTVVIAALLNTYPQQVATTTLLSTFFGLVYIPLMTAWLL